MSEQEDFNTTFFERAANMLRVHGVLSIIFGALGVLSGAAMMLLFTMASYLPDAEVSSYEDELGIGFMLLSLMVFIFWTLPHLYFLISGVYLLKNPSPKLAKGLIIANLVVGVFYDLVIFIFAIISLTQMSDYERGYAAHQKRVHKG